MPGTERASPPGLVIRAARADEAAALALRPALTAAGFETELPEFAADGAVPRAEDERCLTECDAVLVYWGSGSEGQVRKRLDEFVAANHSGVAEDLDGDVVYLARNQFYLDYARERAPGIVFADIKDVKDEAIAAR